MTIFDEIKNSFKQGDILARLIYINLGVFILVKLVQVITYLGNVPGLYNQLIHLLAVPASLSELARKPWTLFTYMFLHEGFLHILFNLLWFYWFGKIFTQFLDSRKVVGVYILGGLTGAGLYILAFNVFPVFSPSLDISIALGASAAVLAIVIAISAYAPNFELHLMFLGPVKLKYIALVTVVIDVLSIASSNAGGHIAHLGGALYGYIFALQMRKGNDISEGFTKVLASIGNYFKPGKKIKVTHRKKPPADDIQYNTQKRQYQEEVDAILDKIAKSGYNSLSKEEKEFLFRAKDN